MWRAGERGWVGRFGEVNVIQINTDADLKWIGKESVVIDFVDFTSSLNYINIAHVEVWIKIMSYV